MKPLFQPGPKKNENLFVTAGTASSLGTIIAVPTVIIPWIWHSLGAPLLAVGLVIPLIQGGRMVAPIITLPWLVRLKRRKWMIVFALGMMALSLSLLGLILILQTSPMISAISLLVLSLLVGLSQGNINFGIKEITARIIDHKRRGHLLTRSATIGGGLSLILAFGFFWAGLNDDSVAVELLHIVAGAALLTVSALTCAGFYETPEPSVKQQSKMDLLRQGKSLLKENILVKRFLIVRLLFLSLDLAYPFYAVHTAVTHGQDSGGLSLIIVFISLAWLLQTPIWGKRLDNQPRGSLVSAALLACLAGVVLLSNQMVDFLHSPVVSGIAFLLITSALQGGMHARNLYLIRMTSKAERPVAIVTIGTIAGIVGLGMAFGLGFIAHYNNIHLAIVGIIALQLAAAIYAFKALPSAPEMALKPAE